MVEEYDSGNGSVLKRWIKNYIGSHSTLGSMTVEEPGSWESLEYIYRNEHDSFLDWIFLHSKASRATRERFKLFKDELYKRTEEYAQNGNDINIIDFACGSGRAVIETLEEANGRTYGTCVDRNEKALDFAQGLSKKRGIENISFVHMDLKDGLKFFDGQYDIAISQGYMDYLERDEAVDFLKNVRGLLKPEGTVIVGNMKNHIAMRVLMDICDWNLVYKNEDEVRDILDESGYGEIDVFTEKEGLHVIGMGKNKL